MMQVIDTSLLVLVTGGSGFIGSNLIKRLLDEGYKVRNLDLNPLKVKHDQLVNITGNYTNKVTAEEAVAGCSAVYHLASTTIPKTSNDDPGFDISSNLLSTVNLLDLSVKHSVAKFIFASSGGTIYGIPKSLPITEAHPTDPICSYGIVKLAIEKYLAMYGKLHGLHTCALRISNPYGPGQDASKGQGVITAFCNKALRNEPLEIWGDGSVIRDYIYIDDLVDAMIKVLAYQCDDIALNIGSGVPHSLDDIANAVETALGYHVKKIYKSGRNFDVHETYLDTNKVKYGLNWASKVSLEQGISNLLKDTQEHSHAK